MKFCLMTFYINEGSVVVNLYILINLGYRKESDLVGIFHNKNFPCRV